MKSILLAGAVLMAGAGIYGFVDYNKTSREKAFRKMYAPGEAAEYIPDKKPAITPVIVPGNKAEAIKKIPVQTQNRLKIPDKEAVKTTNILIPGINPREKEVIEIVETDPPEPKEIESTKAKKGTKRKKELNHTLFSRAPLDERYLDKELKADEIIKAEPGKTEKRKQ